MTKKTYGSDDPPPFDDTAAFLAWQADTAIGCFLARRLGAVVPWGC